MKIQQVIVRGLSGVLTWLQVADILGRSPGRVAKIGETFPLGTARSGLQLEMAR